MTKRMASACAGCMSRRGAPATIRRRCNMRCAPMRVRRRRGPVQAVLDDRTRRGDWAGALATVELERRRTPHRQADREPLARGDQDGDGRGSDGARSEGCARSGAGGLQARADARACGGDQRPARPRKRATIVARAAYSKRLTRKRPIPISPRPICACVTAIPPRIGWPAPEPWRAWRRSIPNRLSRSGAPRSTRATSPAARAAIAAAASPRIRRTAGRPGASAC